MITFFYEAVRKAKLNNRPYWKILYKVNKLLVNVLFPIAARGRKAYGLEGQSRIIVSLTTYPARIDGVWVTISSLLEQTMKPCRVILWLAREQFPDQRIPESLERLKKRGLEIRFCEDLRPHKKYYEAMREYPDYYIVTADDDILYPENHIEALWAGQEKYPDAVICHWSHKIECSLAREDAVFGECRFAPYNDWPDNGLEEPSYATLAVGCNGILYPPGCLGAEAFDRENIREYALDTDDLWLKCMEIVSGRKVVNCNRTVLIYFNRLSTKGSGLWKSNIGQERNNDRIWNRLMETYPGAKQRLIEEIQMAGQRNEEYGEK